jgi:hypothetical protein
MKLYTDENSSRPLETMKRSLPRVLDKRKTNNLPSQLGVLQRIVTQQFSSNDSIREVFLQVFGNWILRNHRREQARKESCPIWNLSVRQFRDTPNAPLTAPLVELVCSMNMLKRWWKTETPGFAPSPTIQLILRGHFRPKATHRESTVDERASDRFIGLSSPVMDLWGIVKGALVRRTFSSVDVLLQELKSAILRGLRDTHLRRVIDFSHLTLEVLMGDTKKRPRSAYNVVLNADGTERGRPTWFSTAAIRQSTNSWQLQNPSDETDEYGVSSRAIKTTWDVKNAAGLL